ncbi:MAG: ABC transporter permease [Acidithiobacillales bacterium SG8_45]|jgi:iron complex transport system permease protein|nr:MAG: ABC transporter permease [Acidithiobacillales bacterium SG8_45]
MTPRGQTALLLLVTAAVALVSISTGSVDIAPGKVFTSLFDSADDPAALVVRELRLPRLLAAFTVGALLAVAGALLQVLLRNPLADPYILGVSGGAAVATLTAMLLGAAGAWLGGSAIVGSLVSVLLVFGLSRYGHGNAQLRLLLTGVIVAAGWGALISLLLSLSSTRQLHGMLFWLMGDLAGTELPIAAIVVLALGSAVAWRFGRALNLLARGESFAAALGENPATLRTVIYFLASILTATAVSLAGSIGFVGLVVPHLLRLAGSTDHRWLIPQCVLLGGSFLVLADTLARTVVAPQQLPVGVITALVGVPLFLYLLIRSDKL